MKLQRVEMEWPAEKVKRALNLVIDEQKFSPLRRQTMKKKLAKLVRQGRLELGKLDTEWLYRLCAASLMLRDYHWFGWEFRSEWAALLCTKPWAYPRWDGSKCRLLVVAEQGLGDEIVFASCYHELAEDVAEAWVEVDPRLIPTFERSFPDNLHFVNRFVHAGKRIVPAAHDYPQFHEGLPIEAFVMAGNVPKLYRQARADFPTQAGGFLYADYRVVDRWGEWLYKKEVLPLRGPWVGCAWKGRQGEIAPIDQGVSLQYGETEHRGLVVPPINLKNDLDEVFALIAALDKVVTTTNAVAHMAGALGRPTDVIKPPPIWATDDDPFNNRVSAWWPPDKNDWYPSITMYRSQEEWRASN